MKAMDERTSFVLKDATISETDECFPSIEVNHLDGDNKKLFIIRGDVSAAPLTDIES